MKKVVCSLLLMILMEETNGRNDDGEELREIRGRVETLEQIIADIQKKIKEQDSRANQERIAILSSKTPEEIIRIILDMLDENKTEEARAILHAFMAQNPTSVYRGMMFFYIGNSYFMEKNYKDAAIAYMKGFKANPGGSKAAETLYKLALCFEQLGDKEKCKSTFGKIISDYPGEYAQKASAALKKRP